MLIVKCKNNEHYNLHLTINKEYSVIKEYNLCYILIDDLKCEQSFSKDRFEIIEEDKQVKEYTLQEIFDLPEGIEYINADAHFEVKNGVLYNWFKPNDKQSVRLTKMYVNMKFMIAEKPVSFIEAITSGKRIKCIHERFGSSGDYLTISKIFELMSKSSYDDFIPTLINEGKWYIED